MAWPFRFFSFFAASLSARGAGGGYPDHSGWTTKKLFYVCRPLLSLCYIIIMSTVYVYSSPPSTQLVCWCHIGNRFPNNDNVSTIRWEWSLINNDQRREPRKDKNQNSKNLIIREMFSFCVWLGDRTWNLLYQTGAFTVWATTKIDVK